MSAGNKHCGVGGTAQDGSISTKDTVKDGGPDGGNENSDSSYQPSEGVDDSAPKTTRSGGQHGQAKTSNPNYGVGGTAKDGDISTADTVADGGPDDGEADPDFKPT
ncbi:hypothetical protein B9Z65_4874 [Elsinoe australis]|uniref:Uncharacterized protein n=1 Tax=Elsinoe australis TaxID=40998 RepID=A0A2P8A6A3_9PEZI|nr:hypothetical protein B9Z65_4874 [Elsinoe australis]